MPHNKKKLGSLAQSQDAFETRRLNTFFLRCMAHLKCRPQPRWRFDFVAMAEPRRHHPGAEAIEDCRTILGAAVATGDRHVINATRREIAQYFDAMKASALREIQQPGMPSISEAVKAFTREAGEAQHAVVCAAVDQTEGAMETALREMREMNNEGERVAELLEASIQHSRGTRTVRVMGQ